MMAWVLCAATSCSPLTDLHLARYRDDKLLAEHTYALGEKYIDINGITWCYQEHGQGDATIIILPGVGTMADYWQLNVPKLAEHFRVLVVDLPGFGKSGKPDVSYTLRWYCRQVLAFMDAKKIHKATIIGGSMGGHIGLLLTLDCPDRVEKLIMTGACGAWAEPGILLGVGFHVLPYELIVSDHLRRSWNNIFHRIFTRQTPMTESLFRYQMAVRARAATYAEQGRASARALRSILYSSCRDRLDEVTKPVLLIWGEDDFIHPPEDGIYLRDHIPGSKLVVVPSVAHEVMVDDPETFNRLVITFVRDGNGVIEDQYRK